MRTSPPDVRPPAAAGTQILKRRGLLAAAWAAAAAFLVRVTTQPIAGANGDPVLAGSSSNSASSETWIQYSGTGRGIFGYAHTGDTAVAVQGWSNGANGTGVLGNSENNSGSSYGVRGTASSPSGTGVFGLASASSGSNYGVRGESRSGVGVYGTIPSTSSSNAIAVYGLNYSTYAGPGPGAGGFGVYGLSAKGHGLVGATAAAGAAALVGATNGVAGAYAGAFYGPVIVGGDFTVVGGAKSAAVPHPDGSHRRLYCLESPESWFEDFGKGQLECGRAEIAIDPDFAALVDLTDYHVFLTERCGDGVLSVVDQTATGFSVVANRAFAALLGKQDAELNSAFSWRIVAKRRDIAGRRLEAVTVPVEPTLPPVPDIPAAPPAASAVENGSPRVLPKR